MPLNRQLIVAAIALVASISACSTRDDEDGPENSADASMTGGDADGGGQAGGDDAGPGDGGNQSGGDGGNGQPQRPTHCLLIDVAGGDTWLLREDGSDPIVLSNVTQAQYTADGRGILYGKDDAIRRVESDGTDDRVVFSAGSSSRLYHPTESPDGLRFAYIQDDSGQRQLRIKDYAGQARTVAVSLNGETIEAMAWPRWSPTGDRIALWVETRDAQGDNIKQLMVVNADGTNAKLVTASQSDVERGDWTADGTKLVHETDDGSIGQTDVSTQATTSFIGSLGTNVDDPIVSADGNRILYRQPGQTGLSEVWRANVSATGQISDQVRLREHSAELAPGDWNPACR